MAANPAVEPDVMTVQEAAEYLKCCDRQVREMVIRGEIFGQKVGKSWRISAADVRRVVHAERPDADPLLGLLAMLPADWRERLPEAISAALVAGLDALMTTDADGRSGTRRKGGRRDLALAEHTRAPR